MAEKVLELQNTQQDPLPAAEISQSASKSVRQQRLLISLIRWCLPLFLFALVSVYETFEHIIDKGEVLENAYFFSEILFFGILGPLAVFGVMTYVQRLLDTQWKTQVVLDELNQGLKRKVAERTAELETRYAELQQLDEMKSEFVALVSHDLRAPLTTLHGGLELALQQIDHMPPEARRTLEIMRSESERLTTFVQDILDISRLDAGRLPIVLGPVTLRPLLERSVEVVLGGKRRIEWDLPSDLPLPLADEVHLEEAIRAILDNAQKYSPADTALHIQVRQVRDCLELSIIDHGPGVVDKMQPRVFDRFYRGIGKGEVQENSGWGLGLYLARRLVEAQNGKLTLRSPAWDDPAAPGAAFTLTLPLDVES
jgi:signal transduction histidine kinase